MHITPLVYLSFETQVLKNKIRVQTLENIQNKASVSTVNLLNTTIPTDIIEIVLEPQILIPLIIGVILIIILIVILFVLCTTERSNAITRIIYSIRGAPKKEDKDVTLNIQNSRAPTPNVIQQPPTTNITNVAPSRPNVAPSRPNVAPPRPNVAPPRPNVAPPRPNVAPQNVAPQRPRPNSQGAATQV